jgi:hypothetical protein
MAFSEKLFAPDIELISSSLGMVCITAATGAGDAEEAGCEFAAPLKQ